MVGKGSNGSVKLYRVPVEGEVNKFVLTGSRGYFAVYNEEEKSPDFVQLLHEIFNLDDEEVVREVDRALAEGRVILGYWNPETRELDVHAPHERTSAVEERLREVFGER